MHNGRRHRQTKGRVLFGAGCLLLSAFGDVRANPIPCETLLAFRAGQNVELRFHAEKQCYPETPEAAEVVVTRDLFEVELDFVFEESEEGYTLSATDYTASARMHSYRVVPAAAMHDVYAEATVPGTQCLALNGVLESTQASLRLSLDMSCLADPDGALEYRVLRNYDTFVSLSWTETAADGYIEATAIDEQASEFPLQLVQYEVGVRAADDSYYAMIRLDPARPDGGVRSDAAALDGGHSAATSEGGGGCRVSTRPQNTAPSLLWLSVIWVLWALRTKRRAPKKRVRDR
jgi:hypothetical protein